jgi:hypothetical protein
MAKVFPVETRVSLNVAELQYYSADLRRFAPFFAQSLIDLTGSKIAPSYYMTTDRAPKLGSLVVLRRRCRL